MSDGCRSDALLRVSVPHIHSMVKQGSSTLAAATVQPTVTLPFPLSIFPSLRPVCQGISENEARPVPLPGVPTITDVVRTARGKETSRSMSKDDP